MCTAFLRAHPRDHQRVDRNRRGIGSRTLAIEGVPHLRCSTSHLARVPALTHGANFWCASGAKVLTGPTKSEAAISRHKNQRYMKKNADRFVGGRQVRDLDFAGLGCCDLLRSQKTRAMPARAERTLAVWALDIPKKERGLMRAISTRKRAMPVKIR
jgi:hypothetical protein